MCGARLKCDTLTVASHRSLSVIIPNYNGVFLIGEFLPSVLEAVKNYPGPKEVIFVDDCSSDLSVSAAAALCPGPLLKVVSTPRNGGFSRACNFGAARAVNSVLFFLNNDVSLAPDYFSTFSGYFEGERVFALAPCGFDYGTGRQIDGIKRGTWKNGFLRFTGNIFNDQLPPAGPFLSFSVQGAYFFCDAAMFRELGGFDEIYSPYIMEETDLAYRALKRGWKILYGPEFRARHKVGSTVKSKVSMRAKIISSRNRLIFTWKNIHSRRLLLGHFLFLALRLAVLNIVEWAGFLKALRLLPQVLPRRAAALAQASVGDEELLAGYAEYFSRFRPRP